MVSTLSGLHFNFHNLLTGLFESREPLHALTCLFPFATAIIMLIGAQNSHLRTEGNMVYFILIAGSFSGLATTKMTLDSMAKIKYQWLFYEPFAFAAILYADMERLVPMDLLGYLYLALLAEIVLKYVVLMLMTVY